MFYTCFKKLNYGNSRVTFSFILTDMHFDFHYSTNFDPTITAVTNVLANKMSPFFLLANCINIHIEINYLRYTGNIFAKEYQIPDLVRTHR